MHIKWLLTVCLFSVCPQALAQVQLCANPNGGVAPCPTWLDEQYRQWAVKEAEWARQEAVWNAEDNVNRKADYWGAISANLKTSATHHVEFVFKPTDALTSAKQACPDSSCDVLVLYRNTCIASASGGQGEMFWADNVEPRKAQENALALCHKNASGSCQVLEDSVVCSGYKYVDIRSGEGGTGQKSLGSKLRMFKANGGVFGLISPKLVGKEIQPAEVSYNPKATQMMGLPAAVRSRVDVAKISQEAAIWVAVAVSRKTGEPTIAVGAAEEIAVFDARKRCAKDDCDLLTTARSGECFAIGFDSGSDGVPRNFAGKGATREQASSSALAQCKKSRFDGCQIGITDCLPEL